MTGNEQFATRTTILIKFSEKGKIWRCFLDNDCGTCTSEKSHAWTCFVTSVLQRWNGKLIAERFNLPEMEVEIERAVEQVENSIKSKEELMEEKIEQEKAAGKAKDEGTLTSGSSIKGEVNMTGTDNGNNAAVDEKEKDAIVQIGADDAVVEDATKDVPPTEPTT